MTGALPAAGHKKITSKCVTIGIRKEMFIPKEERAFRTVISNSRVTY